MRRKFLSIIFVFLTSCLLTANGQFIETNGIVELPSGALDSALIKHNKIAGIKILTYNSVSDTSKGKAELVLEEKYDRKGNITFMKGCLHEGSDPCLEKVDKRFYYNEKGKLVSEVSNNLVKGHKFFDSIYYFYKANEKLQEVKGFYYNQTTYDDTLYSILEFIYNKEENLIENNLIGYTRELYKRVTYERDKYGKITKYTWYDEANKEAESGIISYDEKGKETGRQEFDAKSLSCKIVCKFDKSGKCVERRCYDGEASQTLLVEYKYDGKGRLIDKYEEEPGKTLGTVTKYKYDNNGNITEKAHTLANGEMLYRYVYKYDEKNKLVQEDYFDNSKELVRIYKYKYQFYK